MGSEKWSAVTGDSRAPGFIICFSVFSFLLLACLLCPVCLAVSTKIIHHSSSADLLKGSTEDVVIDSQGTVRLGSSAEVLVEKFEDAGSGPDGKGAVEEPWSINSIVVNTGAVFVGTSPNGGVYRYASGRLTEIYSAESQKSGSIEQDGNEPNDTDKAGGETVEAEQYLANEHIFAMATDVAGRLLVGISGDKCKLCRLEAGRMETVFEPNDAKYIFAIAVGEDGDIYLGTGPKGKVYKLDSFGKESQLIYDSIDKNMLSLAAGEDGFVYAGSDSRGLVYKIDPRTGTAGVLYDSEQDEVVSLLFGEDGCLYAAATSAKIVQAEKKFTAQLPGAGRPELPLGEGKSEGGLKLKIANTKKTTKDKMPKEQEAAPKRARSEQTSYVYKITREGFVTDVFDKTAVFFSMAAQQNRLLLGTGNKGQFFVIEPDLEQQAVIYESEQASQITAVVAAGDDVYLGTANPAKLIKLGKTFASEGAYTSSLIDAGQPARWGKLQIEADIPQGCRVLAASRSGNVGDVNDPTFSDWTKPVQVTEPVQLLCPVGRFCQYKLILQSEDGSESPRVRDIAVAHTVANLAPKVEQVSVSRLDAPNKTGKFKISYKTRDENKDKLIYKIDFRKAGRTNWIEIEDKIKKGSFEWDGRTVEDGRYEIRVTASDQRSNTSETALKDSRISEPVVVDNTGPVIKKHTILKSGTTLTLKLQITDQLSVIGQADYTVDSNAEWISTVPDDLVYDTTEEDFTIVIEDLQAGEHIITIRVSDDVGNTTYKTFEVDMGSG